MWLCNEIIQKYYAVIQQGLQHNYLSSDRIWLKLKPESEKFRIIYSKLSYTIHFVGYQCQFYEREDYKSYQINDDQAIQSIIFEILRVTQQHFRNSVLEKANKKSIFTELNYSFNKGLQEFQMKVHSIIDDNVKQKEQKKNFKNKVPQIITFEQRLSKIDRHFVDLNSGNRRGRRIDDVKKNILEIIKQYYNPNDFNKFEVLFYYTVPLFVKAIKNKFMYETVKPNFILTKKKPDDYFIIDGDLIDSLIQKLDKQKKEKLKLDIDLKEVKIKTLQHVSVAMQKLHYFYNNVEFTINFNEQLKNQVIAMKTELFPEFTEQIYDEQFTLKFLEFLQDLI